MRLEPSRRPLIASLGPTRFESGTIHRIFSSTWFAGFVPPAKTAKRPSTTSPPKSQPKSRIRAGVPSTQLLPVNPLIVGIGPSWTRAAGHGPVVAVADDGAGAAASAATATQ